MCHNTSFLSLLFVAFCILQKKWDRKLPPPPSLALEVFKKGVINLPSKKAKKYVVHSIKDNKTHHENFILYICLQ